MFGGVHPDGLLWKVAGGEFWLRSSYVLDATNLFKIRLTMLKAVGCVPMYGKSPVPFDHDGLTT